MTGPSGDVMPDIPDFLRIPQEERTASWKGRRLTIQGSAFKAQPPPQEEAATRELPTEPVAPREPPRSPAVLEPNTIAAVARMADTMGGFGAARPGSADRRPKYTGFRYQLFDQLSDATPKRHLIKGIFARGETSAWIAPPGGMKSALMALAICVASGAPWFGRRNKERCGVIYFALERADLVRRRLEAHTIREELSGLPVALVSDTVNLMRPDTVAKVVATIRAVQAEFGYPIGLVIFDTFAKLIAAGGGDEDKAKDQGAVFANVQRVKDETDVHVALVGHTGKDIERGARGSNAILGDVDLMVKISGDVVRTATVIKANDAAEGPLFSFRSEQHEFGRDEDGDPVAVNVVVPEEGVVAHAPKAGDRWTKGLRLVRDSLNEALADSGVEHQIVNGPTVRAAPISAARAAHRKLYVHDGDGDRNEAERKAWARNLKAAQERRLIAGEAKGDQQWIWTIG